MAIYLDNVRLPLANLLGEETISNPWPASRDNAIQWSLERLSRIYDFDFGKTVLSKTTDSSGQYTFVTADGVRFDPDLDVRVVVSGIANDHIFDPVNREDFDNFGVGGYRYYVSTDASGNQTLVTTEPSTTIQITASRNAPTISSSTPTNFPSALAIAKGALIYVREFEDKDADVSVEDVKFQQIVNEVIGAEQRAKGPQRAITRAEAMGYYTGQVRSDNQRYW